MFSNDNNIETIAQLVEELKKYVSLQGEYLRLNIVEKTVRLLTVILMAVVLTILFVIAVTFFSFALACGLAPFLGYAISFAIVGAIYAAFFILCILFRKAWIERPLVRFLASILME